MVTRRSTLAGMFYPKDPALLEKQLESFFNNVSLTITGNILGIVCPHAGITYSGLTAAHSYSAIRKDFDGTFIVIGPSHSGFHDCVSSLAWETPLGDLLPDTDLIEKLPVEVDNDAHQQRENSLEVQMPFIKYRFPKSKIVPILLGNQSYENSIAMGEVIFEVLSESKNDVKVVASSDFSHYIPDEDARRYDHYAINGLLNLDTMEFYRRIYTKRISACGIGPIIAMVEACKKSGAHKAELINYMTSGEISGDYDQVVGYAAIAVE
ncbi:AmmeMemoRadiSam system protein B [Methanoplanus sp. FWC-SCC4]|uniref:MEMO1 family protein F1737_07240 n=1 Tax=Methanochimaera problematica TaxID=2609417 RepID=A0AA97I426_9EURY|nr:AmmeMemoRadiSam system protein B [Methanoplanus sp. FWC-SCC4]WOF16511.1 AmmeMemoRadiSam system protein B [Methanoplanus sp. FWC-SCC4]